MRIRAGCPVGDLLGDAWFRDGLSRRLFLDVRAPGRRGAPEFSAVSTWAVVVTDVVPLGAESVAVPAEAAALLARPVLTWLQQLKANGRNIDDPSLQPIRALVALGLRHRKAIQEAKDAVSARPNESGLRDVNIERMTIKQAAVLTCKSEQSFRKRCGKGTLPNAVQDAQKTWWIPRDVVEAEMDPRDFVLGGALTERELEAGDLWALGLSMFAVLVHLGAEVGDAQLKAAQTRVDLLRACGARRIVFYAGPDLPVIDVGELVDQMLEQRGIRRGVSLMLGVVA